MNHFAFKEQFTEWWSGSSSRTGHHFQTAGAADWIRNLMSAKCVQYTLYIFRLPHESSLARKHCLSFSDTQTKWQVEQGLDKGDRHLMNDGFKVLTADYVLHSKAGAFSQLQVVCLL